MIRSRDLNLFHLSPSQQAIHSIRSGRRASAEDGGIAEFVRDATETLHEVVVLSVGSEG